MSGMVERVARALAKEEGYAYDPVPYDARARAAIEAMREPSKEMIDAADDCPIQMGNEGPLPEMSWPAMIDAALKGS